MIAVEVEELLRARQHILPALSEYLWCSLAQTCFLSSSSLVSEFFSCWQHSDKGNLVPEAVHAGMARNWHAKGTKTPAMGMFLLMDWNLKNWSPSCLPSTSCSRVGLSDLQTSPRIVCRSSFTSGMLEIPHSSPHKSFLGAPK